MTTGTDTDRESRTCWVLTDGKAGMKSQCLGLAGTLGMDPVIKRITPRFPWSVLPPQGWFAPLSAPDANSDPLEPPWPNLLIATGRQTVAPAIAIKKASGGKTIAVQIQNPRVSPSKFDLVITPAHDRLSGHNVISTAGALHGVTEERLANASRKFEAQFAELPRPLLAVLIGGTNSQYRLTPALMERLGELLHKAAAYHGTGLVITPSRRTGEENIDRLKEILADIPAFIWDGSGENPYHAMLGSADAIMVTSDSVNMVSEAAATGKPVYIFDLDGGSEKFKRFHKSLAERGVTRKFAGVIESWQYDPPDDMAVACAAVQKLLDAQNR